MFLISRFMDEVNTACTPAQRIIRTKRPFWGCLGGRGPRGYGGGRHPGRERRLQPFNLARYSLDMPSPHRVEKVGRTHITACSWRGGDPCFQKGYNWTGIVT